MLIVEIRRRTSIQVVRAIAAPTSPLVRTRIAVKRKNAVIKTESTARRIRTEVTETNIAMTRTSTGIKRRTEVIKTKISTRAAMKRNLPRIKTENIKVQRTRSIDLKTRTRSVIVTRTVTGVTKTNTAVIKKNTPAHLINTGINTFCLHYKKRIINILLI